MTTKLKKPKPAEEESIEDVEVVTTRRKKSVPAEDEFEPEDPVDQEAQNKLSEFLELFGEQEYKIRVEKQNADNNEWEICDRVMLNGFDPFELSKKFGGGRYRCSLLDNNGKFVAGGRMRFTFAKQDKVATPVPEAGISPIAQIMIENGKQQNAMLMEILKGMFAGHAAASSVAAPSLNDVIQSVKSIHDLSPKTKDVDAAMTLEKMLDLQIKIQKLTGGAGNDDGEGSGTGLGALLGELKEAFSMVTKVKNLPAPQRPPLPSSQRPLVARPTAAPEVVNTMPVYEQKIMSYVPVFVEMAAKNNDVEKAALFLGSVLDTQIVPALVDHYGGFASEDVIWEKLIEAGQDEKTLDLIFTKAPTLAPFREWVAKVIAHAIALETGEPTPVFSAPAPVPEKSADAPAAVPIDMENGVIPVPANGIES